MTQQHQHGLESGDIRPSMTNFSMAPVCEIPKLPEIRPAPVAIVQMSAEVQVPSVVRAMPRVSRSENNRSSAGETLAAIRNWRKRAEEVGWSVKHLAAACRVGLRTLERFFFDAMHSSPHRAMHRWRMDQAAKHLRRGHSVKETAKLVRYQSRTQFSLAFHKRFGKTAEAYAREYASRMPKGMASGSGNSVPHAGIIGSSRAEP
jgi:AraC-like DNA-binding protein